MRLWRGNIQRKTALPASCIPMRGVNGAADDHALPGTPRAKRGVREQSAGTVSEAVNAALPVLTRAGAQSATARMVSP